MSVSTSSPRSMNAYALIAFTSLPIRSVDSAISAARPRAVSDAAIQRSAALVAGPGELARRALSHCRVDARGGERLGQPPRLRDRRDARAHRAARPRRRPRRARERGGRRRASSASRCIATQLLRLLALDARTRRTGRSSTPSTSSASARSAAARRAAAAGLFSSCASPAAIVPSDASRSRFCSRRGDAARRPAEPARITRRWTDGCASASCGEVLRGDHARCGTSVTRPHLPRRAGLGQGRDRAHPGRGAWRLLTGSPSATRRSAPGRSPSSSS